MVEKGRLNRCIDYSCAYKKVVKILLGWARKCITGLQKSIDGVLVRKQANSLQKKRAEIRGKHHPLIKLTEDDKIQMDGVLGARLKMLQNELDELAARVNGLRVPMVLPQNLLGGLDLESLLAKVVVLLVDTTPATPNKNARKGRF
jgi:hypothetical protein